MAIKRRWFDGFAVPVVFESIGDSLVCRTPLIYERFIRINCQLPLSWNLKNIITLHHRKKETNGWRNALYCRENQYQSSASEKVSGGTYI